MRKIVFPRHNCMDHLARSIGEHVPYSTLTYWVFREHLAGKYIYIDDCERMINHIKSARIQLYCQYKSNTYLRDKIQKLFTMGIHLPDIECDILPPEEQFARRYHLLGGDLLLAKKLAHEFALKPYDTSIEEMIHAGGDYNIIKEISLTCNNPAGPRNSTIISS